MADALTQAHQEWLGYVQPVGVVVSITALIGVGLAPERIPPELHNEFRALLPWTQSRFAAFATQILGWRPSDLGTPSDL